METATNDLISACERSFAGIIVQNHRPEPHEAWGALNAGGVRAPDDIMLLFARRVTAPPAQPNKPRSEAVNSIDHADLLVTPGRIVDLADFDPDSTGNLKRKREATAKLRADINSCQRFKKSFTPRVNTRFSSSSRVRILRERTGRSNM